LENRAALANAKAQVIAKVEQASVTPLAKFSMTGLGDPLCLAAGWLKLAWQPCIIYMFIGKLLRYLTLTWLLTLVPDSFWHQLGHWLHLI
jgi:membrane protein YqaA with SNARE-associated domain